MNRKKTYTVCYLIYAAGWLFLHMLCTRMYDDSGIFLPDTLESYMTGKAAWSSRFLVGFFADPLRRMPMIVWSWIDTVMIAAITRLLEQIFNKEKELKVTWLIMGSICLFPFSIMATAGWITTTVVYLWIIAAALYVILIIQRIYEGCKVAVYQYIISALLFLYAIDVEVGVVAMLIILSGCSLRQIWNKNNNLYAPVLTLLAFTRVIFDITWKGSASRYTAEIQNWFSDFGMLDLFHKIILGFSALSYSVYQKYWIPWILLTVMVCLIVFENHHDLFHRAVSAAAVGICGIYPLQFLFQEQYGNIYNVFSQYDLKYGAVSFSNYHEMEGYIQLLLWGTGLICSIYSILCVREHIRNAFIWAVYITAGFGSKFIMGFTPTVRVSAGRTDVWMFFSVLICFIGIYTEWQAKNVKMKKAVACSSVLIGSFSFINSILYAGNPI